MRIGSTFALLFKLALSLSLLAGTPEIASALGQALKHATPEELGAMSELKAPYPLLPDLGEGDIFMVFAHADDELLTLAQFAQFRRTHPDRRLHWIMVSDSGAGKIISAKCLFITPSECRVKEAHQVAACMDIDPPEVMGLPDGKLAQISDLETRIWDQIDLRAEGRRIAAVISSDPSGLYGHPDHVAVHDAISARAHLRGIPLVTYGLPALFQEKLPLKDAGVGRPRPEVTHIMELDPMTQDRLACAMHAYRSQRFLLWHFRQGLSPRSFFNLVDRSFLNLSF